ncbi:MAG: hypothetical protein KJZ93_14565 [Caldilineaceae bacterium]|nr:hypothetical protein [Caldilineaceae bacterium]
MDHPYLVKERDKAGPRPEDENGDRDEDTERIGRQIIKQFVRLRFAASAGKHLVITPFLNTFLNMGPAGAPKHNAPNQADQFGVMAPP